MDEQTLPLRMGRAAGAILIVAALLLGFGGGRLMALAGVVLAIIGTAIIRMTPAPPAPAVDQDVPEAPRRGLEDLLAAVDDPLLLVEGNRVARANAAAILALGEHVLGEDVRTAVRHPAAAELLAHEDGGAVDLVGLGGRDKHWTLSLHPLDSGTRLLRLTDRTAARATERMRVDFVANASHELRTPLASLIGFVETLQEADGPDDAPIRKRFLDIMAGEARRMQRLVDDLISLSRIEADKYRAPGASVALRPLVEEVIAAFGARPEDQQRIGLHVEGVLPPAAGDRPQLAQLLHNLIANALQYGDPARPVSVTVSRRERMVALAVADEGQGIAPEHLPRLTERFYRVDPGRSRAGGGTGLGLAIVKHIVERHRGRLDIASTLGFGTTVTVLLPIASGPAGLGGETPPG